MENGRKMYVETGETSSPVKSVGTLGQIYDNRMEKAHRTDHWKRREGNPKTKPGVQIKSCLERVFRIVGKILGYENWREVSYEAINRYVARTAWNNMLAVGKHSLLQKKRGRKLPLREFVVENAFREAEFAVAAFDVPADENFFWLEREERVAKYGIKARPPKGVPAKTPPKLVEGKVCGKEVVQTERESPNKGLGIRSEYGKVASLLRDDPPPITTIERVTDVVRVTRQEKGGKS